jgi:hypothetical protein
MSASWYATSYRKLFFDFDSPGTTVGLVSAFDAERWAERRRGFRTGRGDIRWSRGSGGQVGHTGGGFGQPTAHETCSHEKRVKR